MALCRLCNPKHKQTSDVDQVNVEDISSDCSSQYSDEDREFDSIYFPELFCCTAEGSAAQPPHITRGKTRAEQSMSQSFRLETDVLPDASVPGENDPRSMDCVVPDLTLEAVRDCLENDDGFLERYLEEFSQAVDIDVGRWLPMAGGMQVRRARFTMPVPQDVPAAIARLAAVPATSTATVVFAHKRLSESEHLILLQQVTHDVPFGETFRVQERMSFRPNPSTGGIAFRKWTTVKWLKALPMILSAIRPITEGKIAKEAPKGGQVFLEVMSQSES